MLKLRKITITMLISCLFALGLMSGCMNAKAGELNTDVSQTCVIGNMRIAIAAEDAEWNNETSSGTVYVVFSATNISNAAASPEKSYKIEARQGSEILEDIPTTSGNDAHKSLSQGEQISYCRAWTLKNSSNVTLTFNDTLGDNAASATVAVVAHE